MSSPTQRRSGSPPPPPIEDVDGDAPTPASHGDPPEVIPGLDDDPPDQVPVPPQASSSSPHQQPRSNPNLLRTMVDSFWAAIDGRMQEQDEENEAESTSRPPQSRPPQSRPPQPPSSSSSGTATPSTSESDAYLRDMLNRSPLDMPPPPDSTFPQEPSVGRAELEPEGSGEAGQGHAGADGQTGPSTVYYRLPFRASDGRRALLAIPGQFLPIAQVPDSNDEGTPAPAPGGQSRTPGTRRVHATVLAPAAPIFVPLGSSFLPFSFLYDSSGFAWPVITPVPTDDPRNPHYTAGPPFPFRIGFGAMGGMGGIPGMAGMGAMGGMAGMAGGHTAAPHPEEQPSPERATTFVDSLETADAELRSRMARLGIGDIGVYGGGGELGCPVCLDVYDEVTPTTTRTPTNPLPPSTTGHCACGRTRYNLRLANLKEDLTLSAYCHCSHCQRLNAAPLVWTTHWKQGAVTWDTNHGDEQGQAAPLQAQGGARLIPCAGSAGTAASPTVPSAAFAPSMAVYEALPGRKWKQRCDSCGTPMGSWNEAKKEWTLWPTTLTRDYQPESDGAERQAQVSPAILQALAPTHHQFYHDDWRLKFLPFERDEAGQGGDNLPKWTGYAGKSARHGCTGPEEPRPNHVVVIPCPGFHTMHRRCLEEWLASKPPSKWSCPMCRASIAPDDLLRRGRPASAPGASQQQGQQQQRQRQQRTLENELAARSQTLREEIHRRERTRGFICDYQACFPEYAEQQQPDAAEAEAEGPTDSEPGPDNSLDRRLVKLAPCGHELHVECLLTSVRVKGELRGGGGEGDQSGDDDDDDDDEGDDGDDDDEGEAQSIRTVGKWVECPVDRREVWAQIPVLAGRRRGKAREGTRKGKERADADADADADLDAAMRSPGLGPGPSPSQQGEKRQFQDAFGRGGGGSGEEEGPPVDEVD